MLKEQKIKNDCLLNMGEKQCRYLSKIEDENTFICLKHTKYKIIIDSCVKENKKSKKNPNGDNCCGVQIESNF